MKKLILGFCGLLITATAWAGAPQNGKVSILGGGTGAGDTQISSATQYRYHGPFSALSEYTPARVELMMPVGGTISNLHVTLHDGPASSTSWTFVLMVNAEISNPNAPTGDSDLECTITHDDVSCSDAVNEVEVSAGDRISLMSVPSCKNPNMWGPLTIACPTRRQMRFSAMFAPGK